MKQELGKSFNKLLHMLEKYGPAVDKYVSTLPDDRFSQVKSTPTCAQLVSKIDSAPLYCVTKSAQERVPNLDSCRLYDSLPPLPTEGLSLDFGGPVAFIQLFEDRAAMQTIADALLVEDPGLDYWIPVILCCVSRMNMEDISGRVAHFVSFTIASGVIGTSRKRVAYHQASSMRFCEPQDNSLFHICLIASVNDEKQMDTSVAKLYGDTLLETSRHAFSSVKAAEADMNFSAEFVRMCCMYVKYLELPTHYVIEEGKKRSEDRVRKKHAARYTEREHWITLDPEEVKVRMKARTDHKGGSHASPLPHLRRAHTRTLRSERYTLARGTTINVRPTWIGDREWADRRMNYRVISRHGASETQA